MGVIVLSPRPRDFWNEYIEEEDRAHLKIFRFVPLDRIIAIDPLGDGYFPVPHIFVEFDKVTGPFSDRESAVLERVGMPGAHVDLRPDNTNRTKIFPDKLPGESDQPPAGFDDTISQSLPITEATAEKLASLFDAVKQGRPPAAGVPSDADRIEALRLRMRQFDEWRDSVALPLFSGFVSRLRTAGHTARVVVRSVDPPREGLRSIELRVRLHIGSPNNPEYRPSGYVRVSMSAYVGWRLDVAPTREDSGNQYAPRSRQQIEGMSQAQLEAEVIGVLERLTRGL